MANNKDRRIKRVHINLKKTQTAEEIEKNIRSCARASDFDPEPLIPYAGQIHQNIRYIINDLHANTVYLIPGQEGIYYIPRLKGATSLVRIYL